MSHFQLLFQPLHFIQLYQSFSWNYGFPQLELCIALFIYFLCVCSFCSLISPRLWSKMTDNVICSKNIYWQKSVWKLQVICSFLSSLTYLHKNCPFVTAENSCYVSSNPCKVLAKVLRKMWFPQFGQWQNFPIYDFQILNRAPKCKNSEIKIYWAK